MLQWKRRKSGQYYTTQFMYRAIKVGPKWELRSNSWKGDKLLAGDYPTLRDAKAAAETIFSRLRR